MLVNMNFNKETLIEIGNEEEPIKEGDFISYDYDRRIFCKTKKGMPIYGMSYENKNDVQDAGASGYFPNNKLAIICPSSGCLIATTNFDHEKEYVTGQTLFAVDGKVTNEYLLIGTHPVVNSIGYVSRWYDDQIPMTSEKIKVLEFFFERQAMMI